MNRRDTFTREVGIYYDEKNNIRKQKLIKS